MLKKKYRLRNNYAFLATYRVKNVVSDKYVVLYRGKLKDDASTPTKVGFVITKKIHKRAVKRNRAKRLYREAYRLALKEGLIDSAQKYLSLVFVIRADALTLNFKECYSSLLKLLKK